MDPLVVSSSVITLLCNLHKFSGLANVGHEDDPEIGDLAILTAFYRDINYLILSSPVSSIFSIDQALRRCKATQEQLIGLLDQIGYPRLKRSSRRQNRMRYALNMFLKHGQLARAKNAYRDAVLLLRDIAMSSVTQRHLESIRLEIEQIRHVTDMDDGSGENLRTLRTNEAGASGTLVPETTDHSLFNATIVLLSNEHPQYVSARGKFDTGADINLISRNLVEKRGLLDLVENLEKGLTIRGIEDAQFTAKAKITLTWYLNKSSYSRMTEFFLTEDDSFDILLGNDFINENNLFHIEPTVRMATHSKMKVVVAAGMFTLKAVYVLARADGVE
ncbi:hypothetical protein K432DRAFT_410579 [Lepidopterella palustris CBS 459.81]|uniref:Uncharacterized protein n=1 Tax=Lepidopterella palustris CBS 459.81 TaxID=1314670 RepID=A0A8E2J8Q7_9PEZI|nr:hypothetical protein K432DRAFT_410579 [Lepidopterella palustris CBS 459.81]